MFESRALRPVDDPSLPEDDWPLFDLKEVTIAIHRRGASEELVDLFDVSERGPFRATGYLCKLPKKYKKLAKLQNIYNVPIVIPRVWTYSIEQLQDGGIKIWLLGQSGWYGIQAAKEYQPIYNTMLEKSGLWTFLEDKYLELFQNKRKIKGTVDDLFAEYLEDDRSVCDSVLGAKTLFRKHHKFLILKMLEETEMKSQWMRTPLYSFLVHSYSDVFEEVEGILEKMRKRAEDLAMRGPSPVIEEDETPPPRKPVTVHKRSPIQPVFAFLENYVCSGNVKPSDVTLSELVKVFGQNFDMDSSKKAKDTLRAWAPELLVLMSTSDRYDWINRMAYTELQEEAKIPPKDIENLQAEKYLQKRPGELHSTIRLGSYSPTLPRSLPRVSSPAIKQEGANEDPEMKETPATAINQFTAVLRPVVTVMPSNFNNIKRRADSSMTAEEKWNSKRCRIAETKTKAFVDADISSHRSSSYIKSGITAWEKLKPGRGKPPVMVGKLPDTTSNIPGGHWQCKFNGCKEVVTDANTEEGRTIVENHLRGHRRIGKNAIKTIDTETTWNSGYQVDHLLAKIEDMAREWAESRPLPVPSALYF